MDTFCPNPKSIYKNFTKKLQKNCKKIAKKLQKSCKKIAKKLQKSCKMRKRNFLLCKIFANFLQILNLHTDFRPREESVTDSSRGLKCKTFCKMCSCKNSAKNLQKFCRFFCKIFATFLQLLCNFFAIFLQIFCNFFAKFL